MENDIPNKLEIVFFKGNLYKKHIEGVLTSFPDKNDKRRNTTKWAMKLLKEVQLAVHVIVYNGETCKITLLLSAWS